MPRLPSRAGSRPRRVAPRRPAACRLPAGPARGSLRPARHPWAVAPLFARPNPGLSSVRIGELALGILRRGGFSEARAVAAFSGIIALNYGWSSFTTARDRDPEHDVGAMLAQLAPTEYPLTVDVADEIGAYGSDRHYDFVLDRLLSGLRATADTKP